jgi:hypothetical protein
VEVVAGMGVIYFLNWTLDQVSLVTQLFDLDWFIKQQVLNYKSFSTSSNPSHPVLCVRPCFVKQEN